MSTWRTKTTNKVLAGVCLGLLLLAAFPVCAFAFDGIVTPKGAKSRERGTGMTEHSADMTEQNESAEDGRSTDDTGDAGSEEASGGAASSDGEENSGSSTRTAAGAAVLVGAGAYTYMRGRWKEKDKERDDAGAPGEKYVYFENHTKAGVEKAERNAIGNAGKVMVENEGRSESKM